MFLQSAFSITAESPHGKSLKIECSVCHSPNSWTYKKNATFNHNKTHFPLRGQHNMTDCRSCHTSLVFSEARTECASCHKDMHQGTVGNDCNRCHTPDSWIVKNVKQLHQEQGFALVGDHATADCNNCHKSASLLRFDNLNSECVACHKTQYDAATIIIPGSTDRIPHSELPTVGSKTDCYHCHNMVGRSWSYTGKGFEHGFFPLKGGHDGLSCVDCHWNGYSNTLSRECSSCHSSYKAEAKFPAHTSAYLNHECSECHTYLGWNIIKFKNHKPWHDSGEHKNVACLECHNNDVTYKPNCRKCHNFDF